MNGEATPSTQLVAAVQQSIAGNPANAPAMIQLPPPPVGNAPVPPVISTTSLQAGASFGRRGTRNQPTDNSVSNISMVSINGQSYNGAVYDPQGNRLG